MPPASMSVFGKRVSLPCGRIAIVHRRASKHVNMHVVHHLTGVIARIDQNAVAVLSNAFDIGNFYNSCKHMAKDVFRGCCLLMLSSKCR